MVNERELLEAWRCAMRVWIRRRDVGQVAELVAGFSPEVREALLAGPECDGLRTEIEELLRQRQRQMVLV